MICICSHLFISFNLGHTFLFEATGLKKGNKLILDKNGSSGAWEHYDTILFFNKWQLFHVNQKICSFKHFFWYLILFSEFKCDIIQNVKKFSTKLINQIGLFYIVSASIWLPGWEHYDNISFFNKWVRVCY